MTLRSSHIRPLLTLALAAAVVFVTASSGLAQAVPSEGIAWVRTFMGPEDVLNPNPPVNPPDFYDPYIRMAGALDSVSFADDTNGWAVGLRINDVTSSSRTFDSLVARTDNGGSTWTSETVPGAAVELRGVDAVSTRDVWVVGEAGTIAHWNGDSWSMKTPPPVFVGRSLRGVAFADAMHGWIVGSGGAAAFTGDGGATWTDLSTSGAALNAVCSLSATSAIAVGNGGTVRVLSASTNVARTSGTTANLWSVAVAGTSRLWAVGDNATVIRSVDDGATWTVAALPIPSGFKVGNLGMRSVCFADPADGIIVGKYQMVWRTVDAGATWSAQQIASTELSGQEELHGVTFAGSGHTPVVVSRPYLALERLSRAYVFTGTWTGIGAPVTTSDAVPYYAGTAAIHLTAIDYDGPGVAHTYYSLDGAAQVESATVNVTGAGSHSLSFWSVDGAANVESAKTVTFTIIAPPSSSGTPSKPSTPSSVRHGVSFTTYGYISRHSSSTKTVTLQFYRSEHGHWVLRKTVTAHISSMLSFSKYSDSTSVPYSGSWRVRARNNDGGHSHYSSYQSFTAR
jgi:photosystem II stability/assembly factor-like uncharacterized protein